MPRRSRSDHPQSAEVSKVRTYQTKCKNIQMIDQERIGSNSGIKANKLISAVECVKDSCDHSGAHVDVNAPYQNVALRIIGCIPVTRSASIKVIGTTDFTR